MRIHKIINTGITPFIFRFISQRVFIQFISIHSQISYSIIRNDIGIIHKLGSRIPLFSFICQLVNNQIIIYQILGRRMFQPALKDPVFFKQRTTSQLF